MDHFKKINELISAFDLTKRSEVNKAYRRCLDYADEHLSGDMQCNTFLNKAAELLNQPKVLKNSAEQKAIAHEESKIYLYFSEANGPCLAGNADGLKYLSEVTQSLSHSSLPGEHIHLYYEEFPLYGDSYPLTIYVENDEWFEKYALKESEENKEESNEEVSKRNVDLNTLYAFMANTGPPPNMPLISNKIYTIISHEPYIDQKAWSKSIREDKSRMIVARFLNEDDEEDYFAFDIDDKAIILFKEDDLIQINNKF
jgi:hypothetical protein